MSQTSHIMEQSCPEYTSGQGRVVPQVVAGPYVAGVWYMSMYPPFRSAPFISSTSTCLLLVMRVTLSLDSNTLYD